MRCEDAREALSAARYGGDAPGADVSAHLDGCAVCRAFAGRSEALEAALATDASQEPRPGFDTRFFARLDEARAARSRRSWRWLPWTIGLTGAVAMTAAVVLWLGRGERIDAARDLALVDDLELVEDLDLLRKLDEVEAFAALSELGPDELDALDRGEGTP